MPRPKKDLTQEEFLKHYADGIEFVEAVDIAPWLDDQGIETEPDDDTTIYLIGGKRTNNETE